MILKNEDRFILAAARISPTPEEIRIMENQLYSVKEWGYLYNYSNLNGLCPIIYKNLCILNNRTIIPEEIFLKFKQIYYQSLSRNLILYEHFRNTVKALSAEGIGVIALKGIYLTAAVYQDIGLRQMSDIDLLVKKDEEEKSRNILMKMGYQSIPSEFIHPTSTIEELHDYKHSDSLVKNGVLVEIHIKIHLDTPEYQVNLNDYWDKAIQENIYGTDVLILSPEHQLQHIALHLYEHFKAGKIMLYSFTDMVSFSRLFKNKIDYYLFDKYNLLYHCQEPVNAMLYLSNQYFGTFLPENYYKKNFKSNHFRIEKLFLSHLKKDADGIEKGMDNYNIRKLKSLKNIKEKSNYLLGNIFPSKEFMKNRYKIKSGYALYGYYVIRFFTGIKKLGMFYYNRLF